MGKLILVLLAVFLSPIIFDDIKSKPQYNKRIGIQNVKLECSSKPICLKCTYCKIHLDKIYLNKNTICSLKTFFYNPVFLLKNTHNIEYMCKVYKHIDTLWKNEEDSIKIKFKNEQLTYYDLYILDHRSRDLIFELANSHITSEQLNNLTWNK